MNNSENAKKPAQQNSEQAEDPKGKVTISPDNHGNVGQREPSEAERPDLQREERGR